MPIMKIQSLIFDGVSKWQINGLINELIFDVAKMSMNKYAAIWYFLMYSNLNLIINARYDICLR